MMNKKNNHSSSDLHQYLVDEVIEDYSEGHLSRRRALTMLASLTGAALATQLLDACASVTKTSSPEGKTAPAAKSPFSVAADDPSIKAQEVEFPSGDSRITGYMAHPSQDGNEKLPIILVCHENRGLTTHIQDVTRRFAKSGYLAIAADLLSREGGTAKHSSDTIPGLLGKVAPERHVQDFQSALAFAKSYGRARANNPGMVGFCFGGGVTWRTAVATPELRAIVPFYGPPPAAADIPKLKAAVLAIYAGKDARINAMIPDAEAALKKNGKTFEKVIYPNVDHAFHNDSGERYNEEAAKQAWEKTLAWFKEYLKPGKA